jgi:hypothetical protein
MTYFEAAVAVLTNENRDLTSREITDLALKAGLIKSSGKTPEQSMAAALYVGVQTDPRLVKVSKPGKRRAQRGSVRWALRSRVK